jgi:hypothetical protein
MTEHTNRERPHAADEIRQRVRDKIDDALNHNSNQPGKRDITQAIVGDVDREINDTDEALDKGPDTSD